ncbi:hypothetical protein V8F33_004225 [Rhypophila sp. PSN 637]
MIGAGLAAYSVFMSILLPVPLVPHHWPGLAAEYVTTSPSVRRFAYRRYQPVSIAKRFQEPTTTRCILDVFPKQGSACRELILK